MTHASDGRKGILTAAFAVVIADGKVLLHQRKNSGHKNGEYGLPSGHLEGGETVKRCAVRELREETGLVALEDDLEVVHVLHNYEELEYFNFFTTVKKWSGVPENMEPERCGDVAWFPLDALPANTIGYVRFALENIRKGVFYDNWGWEGK